jgi:hypothetical protein
MRRRRTFDPILLLFAALFGILACGGLLIGDSASAIVGGFVSLGCIFMARVNR